MRFFKLIGFIFLLCIIFINLSNASNINKYYEKISIDNNGEANIEVTINIKPDSTNQVTLPFIFKKCENLKLIEDAYGKITITGINGTRFITIYLYENCKDSITIHYSFKVPGYYDFKNAEETDFGNLTHQYRFVNTTYNTINVFSGEIILPEGYIITSIESSYPKLTEKNPIAPYELSQAGNRYNTIIKSSNLKIGDYTSIQFRFKKSAKSKVLLFSLIGVVLLYLIFFRDILKDEVVEK
jgi:hypothetical protein